MFQYQDPNMWFPDSGATHHMTGDASAIHTPQPYHGPNSVQLGNGDSFHITSTSTIPISLNSALFYLRIVFLVPSLRKNLLSVARFTYDNNVAICFFPHFYRIYDLWTGSLLFQGPCKDGLYPLSFSSLQALTASLSTVWHQRLYHPSSSVLSRLRPHLGSRFISSKHFCKSCALGKSTQLPFEFNNVRATTPFFIIHSNIWMSTINSVSGFRYYVLFIDDYSRYSSIFPMKKKLEVFTHFQTFVTMAKNLFNASIKYFQSDGGTEYVNHSFFEFCHLLGIHQ